MIRAAGSFGQLMAKEGDYAQIRMPSGEIRKVLQVVRDDDVPALFLVAPSEGRSWHRVLRKGSHDVAWTPVEAEEVRARLTYEVCIPLVRAAMIAFSRGETRQLLRSIIPLADGRMFGIMPGALGERAVFGAKLISVFPDNFAKGIQSHQGVIVLFDGDSGAPPDPTIDVAPPITKRSSPQRTWSVDALDVEGMTAWSRTPVRHS